MKKIIGIGTSALCIKDGNEVTKIFYSNEFKDSNERKEFLTKISHFDNDCFIYPNKLLTRNSKLKGYTYDYVDSKLLKNINGDITRVLDDFERLEKSVKNLSENGICVNDLTNKNIFFNGKFSLIDLDRYYESNDSYEYIYNKNMYKILYQIMAGILEVPNFHGFIFYNFNLQNIISKVVSDPRYFYSLVDAITKIYDETDINELRGKNLCRTYSNLIYYRTL